LRTAIVWITLALLPAAAVAQESLKDLDTPYVPTPQVVVDRMLDMARLKAGETVIDLGSGDGRIMIEAAAKYGARGFGVEIDPRLVKLSNERAAQAGVADRVKFLQQDLFKTDFREANVLTLYLLPDVNLALRPKILAELRPGSRVVSHDYGMGDWRPDAEATIPAPDKKVGARKESQVFMWTVPARVAGQWTLDLTIDGQLRRLRLSLAQRYQFLSGSLIAGDGKASPLTDGKVLGEDLRLTLPAGSAGREPLSLEGRLERNGAAGVVRRARGEGGTWSARRNSPEVSGADPALQSYVRCDGFAGGVRGVALDRRPADAAPWREVGLDAKTERVSVLDGYRVMYTYPRTYWFANLKAERSDPARYEQDKRVVTEYFVALASADGNTMLTDFSRRGFAGQTLTKKELAGSTLGITQILSDRDAVIVTIFFMNQEPENRAFQTYGEFIGMRDDFVRGYIDCVAEKRGDSR
jgi:hypothetical protein